MSTRVTKNEVERYGFTRCVVAAIHHDAYAGPWEVEDRDDGAWGEVDELLAIRDHLDSRALAEALGIDPDAHEDLDEAIAQRLAAVREGATTLGVTDEACGAYNGEAHDYLSTGCLHGRHHYCQSMTGQQGEKRLGRCKFCDARCRCSCHREGGAS